MSPRPTQTAGMISIHALREEGDRLVDYAAVCAPLFLSTPSARRATGRGRHLRSCQLISIHALREEGDVMMNLLSRVLQYFYPRPPRGGRRPLHRHSSMCPLFLSTPSARRATENGY